MDMATLNRRLERATTEFEGILSKLEAQAETTSTADSPGNVVLGQVRQGAALQQGPGLGQGLDHASLMSNAMIQRLIAMSLSVD
jgi:hypothetical protein